MADPAGAAEAKEGFFSALIEADFLLGQELALEKFEIQVFQNLNPGPTFLASNSWLPEIKSIN